MPSDSLSPHSVAQRQLRYRGADDRDRTGDLVLTKDALCQLSYIGHKTAGSRRQANPTSATLQRILGQLVRLALNRFPPTPTCLPPATASEPMERETGIEPATNSLEGCDSTTELLPPSRIHCAARYGGRARPSATSCLRFSHVTGGTPAVASQPWRSLLGCQPELAVAPVTPHAAAASESWWRGEDSNLRSRWGDRFTVCCV